MTTLRFSILILVPSALWLVGCPSKDDVHDGDGDRFPEGTGPNQDCDDTNYEINPDATEAPNYQDDDCDDLVDEGTEYQDLDEDGYFAKTRGGSDCDDDDAAIHPGVEEVCRDGKDQNCDEAADPCLIVGDLTNDSFDAIVDGGRADDHLAQSLAGPGDVTGDSLPDVALTVPGRGEVWVYSAERLLSDMDEPDVTITGVEGDLTFSPAGDLDGDGPVDLIVAAPRDAGEGAVWVIPGPLSGPGMALDDDTMLVVTGEDREQLGAALGWICDVDGAFCWLVVGVPEMDGSADTPGSEGGLVFVQASEDRLSTRVAGLDRDAKAGSAFATGDLDDNGVDDLAVGAPSARRDPLDPVSETTGGVYVMLEPDPDSLKGGFSGADDNLVWLGGVAAGGRTGAQVVNAGDMDGDGFDDLAISSPGVGGGRVDVFLGPVRGGDLDSASVTWLGCELGDHAGEALAGGADLDRDEAIDLLVGAPFADGDAGAVYLVNYPGVGADSTYSFSTADATWSLKDDPAMLFGQSLAVPGDVNGDSYPDAVVGAPGTGVTGIANGGGVFLLLGTGM